MYAIRSYYDEPGIIGDYDTEFLHDYRVALRKVRSVLSLFQGVYSAKDTERLKLAVADVMKSTNKLVITSYSIHYTKLYDEGAHPCQAEQAQTAEAGP